MPTLPTQRSQGRRSRPSIFLWALLAAVILASLLPCLVSAGPIVGQARPQPTPQPDAVLVGRDVAQPAVTPLEVTPVQRIYDKRQQIDTTTTELPTAVSVIEGNPSPTHTAHQDPLLAIMPDFAFSMPAQVVVDGINLALVSMLSIHLLFTVQYHYPLSRKNYLLQTSSTLMLLINYSVHLHVLLRKLHRQSRTWPYMFAYIGTQIPPADNSWNKAEQVFYLIMRALATALAHLTHIQFLTLLFPSALEARLIFWMLGPLALAASGMEFTALSSDDDVKTSDLGDAIRNICNSTLYLLYTSALLIWGLLVNRRRAWRTDGGTAAFGCGSVGLAFINTGVSFVEIAFDRLWWLPDICWSLTVWQSWLGFWWWVGSGMGIGEVEDRAERLERRRKREERLKRKREREEAKEEKARAKAAMLGTGSGTGGVGNSGESDVMQGIRRIRDKIAVETKDAGNTLNRRLGRAGKARDTGAASSNAGTNLGDGRDPETIELEEVRTHVPRTGEELAGDVASAAGAATGAAADDARTTAGSGSSDSHPTGTSATSPSSSTGAMGALIDWLAFHQPNFIRSRMKRLRMAHAAAARRAATQQTAIRDQVLNAGRGDRAPGLRAMIIERGAGASQDLGRPSAVGGEAGPSSGRRFSAGGGGDGITRSTSEVRRSGTTSRGAANRAMAMDDGNGEGPSRLHRNLDLDGNGNGRRSATTSLRRSPLVVNTALGSGGGAGFSSDRTPGNESATLINPSQSSRSRSTLDSEMRREGGGGESSRGHARGEEEEGEWIDAGEDEDAGASQDEEDAEAARASSKGKRGGFNLGSSRFLRHQDSSTTAAGESSRTAKASTSTRSTSAWSLRNALQGARVRDRERFSDEEDEEEEIDEGREREEEERKRKRR